MHQHGTATPEIQITPVRSSWDNLAMERRVNIATLHDPNARAADLAYWLSQPVQARLAALEALREQHIATLPDAEQRFQRVCRVVSLEEHRRETE